MTPALDRRGFLRTRLMKTRSAQFDILMSLLLLIAASGCWGSGHPTKKVRGMVTFLGQKPPKEGEVFFSPKSYGPGSSNQRAALGTFDSSGQFELTTWEPGDGAAPGTYVVSITCWRETPTLATKDTANYVPPDFVHEITIDPQAKEPVEITIDVPRLQK